MHAMFSIPDVVLNILDFVNLQVPDEVDPFSGHHQPWHYNPTLAAVAVTCKAFMEPALNVLWRSQRSLGPLVRTLPTDLWEEEAVGTYWSRPAYEIELFRAPLGSEWSRFDFYAHRIRELGHWRFEFPDRHAENHIGLGDVTLRRRVTFGVIALLALFRRNRWLLPNLTSLRWIREDYPYTDLLPLFLGPKMTRLAIGYNAAPEENSGLAESRLGPQISSICAICPTLTQLEIYPDHPTSVIDAAVGFAMHCSRLESFLISSVEPWPVAFIQHLSRQPFLREVRLRMDQETSDDLGFLHMASLHYPFPSLQLLSIMVPCLTPCVKLIQMMRTCRLTTAVFHLTDHVFPSEIADLFTALYEHCSLVTLQVVEIHRTNKRDWDLLDEDAFHLTHLEPLLSFPNIRGFTINTPLIVEMGNDDIKAIADSWPLLVALLLMNDWGFVTLPEITWAGVAYLVWKCPQLFTLSLSLDSRIDDVALTTSLPSFRPNKHLRFLCVTDSVLDDVEVFAHSLFAIAPLIIGINGWGHENETLEISVPLENPSAFLDHVESLMWELRRTQMRDQFAFLDAYIRNEAEEMNPFSTTRPKFPFVKLGRCAMDTQLGLWLTDSAPTLNFESSITSFGGLVDDTSENIQRCLTMDLPFLPVNIFWLIMEVSPRPTVAMMTRTCRTLRAGGTRFLLSGGVSLSTEDIISFALFIHADPGRRFQNFRSLEFPNGKCTAELAATLLGIISHPSLVLDSLTLWNAESFLWSTPTPSKSPDFQDHPDQAPFVSAFARLKTLRHLRLMQCGQCARHLLTTLRSPLKSVCIGFRPSIYGFWSMLREGDWFDRNPILLLRNVTDSLEGLSSVNFGEPHIFGDSVPVYPLVRRLTMTICKGGLRAFPIDNLVSYITALPNLTHISLISENSDGSLMGCFDRRYDDATYGHGNRRGNRRAQAVHGRTWMHLEEVSGGLHEVRSLGLACRVTCMRVTGGIWSDTMRLVPSVLEDTKPTRLALTILGAGTFDNDGAAAVFRDPNTQQIQTLELTLCFSPEEELEDVNVVVKNVIRSLGSLPALRNVIFTLNSGLVCPPTEAYRARRGWHSRTEREVDGLDLEACATLFRKAIPTLVGVAVRRSKDRTRWDSEALYGPDWQLPDLEY